MRTIKLLLFVLAVSLSAFGQNFIYQGTFVMTNNPSDGNTMVLNGTTKTFKTSVSSASSQISIGGSISATLANVSSHVAIYPFSGTTYILSGTNFAFLNPIGTATTASLSGTWGTVTTNSYAATSSGFVVPKPAGISSAIETTNVNNLLSTLQYGTTQIPETYSSFTNFFMRARAQTISGANTFSGVNTFSGANVFSNASQQFVGGIVSSVVLSNVSRLDVTNVYAQGTVSIVGDIIITNNQANALKFFDTSGGSNQKASEIDSGRDGFNFLYNNDDGTPAFTVFSIGRSGSSATTAYFDEPLQATLFFDTTITNCTVTNSIGGFTAVYVNGTMGTTNGNVGITNNAAKLYFYDTGGSTDDKITKVLADADRFVIEFDADAGGLVSQPMIIQRTDGVATEIDLTGAVIASGTIAANDGISSGGIVTAGNEGPTAPASATGGFYEFDSSAPSADPLTGSYFWSESGVAKYRTSTSSEGAGGDNRIHNRTATTTGAGTDYSFTTSTAAIDFGTTDPNITLPTAGTYLFLADIRFTNGATAADEYQFKLRNVTTSTDVISDAVVTCAAASQKMQLTIQGTMTCAASDVIAIYGFNNSGSARGTCISAGTRIRYVRLY